MMEPVFADTAFFLALINPRDQYHCAAIKLNSELDAHLVTTAWVLVEYANAISSSHSRTSFERLLTHLQSEEDVTVIASDPELFERGCRLYIARPDQHWSLTDCISFVIMERDGLKNALTADRHFVQAGFNALLRS